MAEHRKSFIDWLSKPEAMIGLSAVIVSVVAVFVSAYETRIQRDWQRAAVWPYVQLSRSFYFKGDVSSSVDQRQWTLTLNAENVGVGPAEIRDFKVTVDGKPYQTWESALQALLGSEKTNAFGETTVNGTILPSGRQIQMVQYYNQSDVQKLAAETGRLDFSACYCSVFKDCWRTRFSASGAEKVRQCLPDESSFQQ